MLSQNTQKELDKFTSDLISNFSSPELITGCEVLGITDKDEYADNNGWIEALCGKHNNQRCRWTGQLPDIQIGDYVDVIFYPSYRLFVVFGQGGNGASKNNNYLLVDGSRDSTGLQDFTAGIKTDTIVESTAAAGVTVDGVLLKDLDVFPNGDKMGLARRFINPLGLTVYTDHFRTGSAGAGYSWLNPATGLIIVPSVLDYSRYGDYLYVSETTASQRDFYCKTAGTYNGAQIFARLACGINGEIGLRIDDAANPTTNFCEIYITGVLGGGLARLDWRYNSSTPTTGLTFPAGSPMIVRLYLSGGTQFIGYTNSEFNTVNIFNSPSGLTWPGTAFGLGNLRAGMFYKHTGSLGNPGLVDWFYSTF